MKAFKFFIGSKYVPLPSSPGLEVKDIQAVVLAETEEQAREIIKADDWDSRWLEVAHVKVIELDTPRILSYLQA